MSSISYWGIQLKSCDAVGDKGLRGPGPAVSRVFTILSLSSSWTVSTATGSCLSYDVLSSTGSVDMTDGVRSVNLSCAVLWLRPDASCSNVFLEGLAALKQLISRSR